MGLGGIKLADYADPRAVSRGVGLAASAKAVVDRTVRRDDDTMIISAQVASASGIADYFETSVMFGDFESRIVDYECTCPAIARFDGLCKHCVALVTTYFTQPRSFRDVGANRAASRSQRTTSEALARCLARRDGAATQHRAAGTRLGRGARQCSSDAAPCLRRASLVDAARCGRPAAAPTWCATLRPLPIACSVGSTSPTGRSSPLPIGSRPSTGLPAPWPARWPSCFPMSACSAARRSERRREQARGAPARGGAGRHARCHGGARLIHPWGMGGAASGCEPGPWSLVRGRAMRSRATETAFGLSPGIFRH